MFLKFQPLISESANLCKCKLKDITINYFFNMLYFSKYIYITTTKEYSMSAHQMLHTALEKSVIVEMLTYLNLAHII